MQRKLFMRIDLSARHKATLSDDLPIRSGTYRRKEYDETDHVRGKEDVVGFLPPE